jgi:hypothetical protein
MSFWRKRELLGLPAEPTREEVRAHWEAALALWHKENPLRTWLVTYAKADGSPLGGKPEEVKAHRFTLETAANESVFLFHVITPGVIKYPYYQVRENAVQPLTIPFARVHSINMEMEEETDEPTTTREPV